MFRSAAVGCCVLLCVTLSWSQSNIPGGAVPNSKHYRDSGVGNATGRSGSAVMTARALLGNDGNTTIELTTGTLDSSTTPPGSFDHVQFKPFSQAGNPLYTQNSSPGTATGYYSFTSPSLHRAEQVQLQGNITGIDKSRTDVVTVVETVKLRPDLAVEALQLPPTAMIDDMVNISADIVEINGDAGANSTCQLFVDGTLADSTPQPIWVDAGGSVSCAFAYRFTAAGSHTVQVVAANVTPADWDTQNNSASGTINITDSTPLQHVFADFSDSKGKFPLIATNSEEIWLNGVLVENYSETLGNSGESQSASAEFFNGGCGANPAPFQFPVNLTYSEAMDGNPVYAFSANGISGNIGVFPTSTILCGTQAVSIAEQYGYFQESGDYVESRQYLDASGNVIAALEDFEIMRQAGTVTYFSSGYSCYWWNNPSTPCNNPPQGYYFFNYSGTRNYPAPVPLGNTWTPSVRIEDAGGNNYAGSINVGLTTTQYNYNVPESCNNIGPDPGGYTYEFCSSVNENYTQTSGTASQ